MSKRKLSRQQRWRIEKIQAERAARATRHDVQEEALLTAGDYGAEQPGRVMAHFGRTLDVRPNADDESIRCHLRANLDGLVTGDRVIWRGRTDTEGRIVEGVVVARGERDNVLERPDARGQLKPVAANIDQILVVFAVEPEPHPNLIDRYLVAAEATGIPPVLVLNKVDLLPDGGGELMALLQRYAALGYPVVATTTAREDGLASLLSRLAGRTSVFVGQSGVGKSSLIDRLLPDEGLRIGDLSKDSRKGTHTTTTARLYRLPRAEGAELIDSPGIREFGLGHLTERQVTEGFIEFRPYLGQCRFRDCRHRQEPGCALLAAVEREEIHPERFASYRRILDSLEVS
ncbi:MULTISPECIES: small ribosomal subunit biogenesis GTPase RsgA [unclassified Halomonas]|uniref:small ribosomal subunit biogenesis GTPase RsgA n=1 Tax=unclassified Halomonas TaxID=2609666 RepID=UPI00288701B6|nr:MULTISPECIES: small ribosomal subunit biogenesis GTPase RsgA [unclassified Halomonas]MDT0501894.1 small ribosomal subunit biogenesis GTPase RsgA [Halomonas sp. PAR7]MDT0513565.1 small ribosomal subunit biogenesis GTPase RsgA [Halomonas sp. LES1]MDT0592513.1 small ribosomal subunit biogenesis GTPase RsgA [Halomonas sp. PAR8]